MKYPPLVIRSKEVAARAAAIISNLDHDDLHEVIIRPYKKDRSVAQNSLLWKWTTVIAEEMGETKEDVHERNKERFLVPIYERDDADYAAMIEAVRSVHRQGMKADAEAMRKQIVKLTSTTTASVKQFTEFLTEIERDAMKYAIRLPHPDDIYELAMRRAA